MRQGTRFHILVFMMITLLCLSGLGFLFVLNDSAITQSDETIGQSREVISETQDMMILAYGLLGIQRNYLLTGDPALLDEYNSGKTRMTETAARLNQLTKDIPTQKSRVTELQHHTLGLIGKMDDIILQHESGVDDAGKNDAGKIAEFRRTIERVSGAIMADAYQMMNAYIAKLEQARKSLYRQLSIGIAAASVFLTLLNYYMLHMNGRRVSAETSLREAEERFRLAIRGTNDGIYDLDIKTQQLYWSPQLKMMLGYEDGELEPSRATLNSLLHSDDREHFWAAITGYINRESSDLAVICRMQHKQGHWIWVNVRGKALFDEDGEAMRLIGTHSDITNLKEYEARLEDAKIQAEKANEAKTEFLAHMSHEIRTPLTSISGIAELLSSQTADLSPRQRQLVKVLSYSTAGLKELINDILDFAKIESGQLSMEEKPFLIDELFQEVISIMAVRAQEKGLRFTFDYDTVSGIRFVGDKLRLRQVLMNLIGNALKFTHQGFVSVSAAQDNSGELPLLRIAVKDSGIGIDPKNHKVVFERFRQADSSVSRKYGGTGLGLPISRNLLERMGGHIALDSAAGAGSTFTIEVPLREATEKVRNDNNMTIAAAGPGLRRALTGTSDRILLVEDYEGNIAVLSYILESLHYDFDVARTGLEAVSLWREKSYSLILMDVQMPEMDGLTATRQIRQIEAEMNMPHTPIIGMTAHAFIEDKDKCTKAGMDSYLAKPVSEQDLVAEITSYLESGEARQKNRQASAG